jgi:acetolactate synthase-1/2/3 large subunit
MNIWCGEMKAAEYIVKFLEEKDARIVYGLPGYNILEIYEAIRKSSIEHVLVKHEHSAAVMADVTGRLTLKPGVCLVTAGPGALNTATGVAAAYTAASPMLHITGHCSSREKVQPYHGVEDWLFLEKIFANITKWSKTVDNALELPYHIEKAYHIATSGRKGPVHISLAMDILEVDIQKTLNTYKGELQLGAKDVAKRIAKKLMELEKPIIVAGKGVLRENSTMEIEELMEKTYIPTLASRRSRDVIPFNNKLNIGYTIIVGFGNILEDLRKFLEEADGIITVGLDRGERESRDIMELSKSKRIIHIYQEEPPYGEIIEDNGRIIEVNTPNLKQLLKELIGEVNGYRSKWTNLENRIAELKGKVESDLKEHAYRFSKQKPIHPAYLVQTIKEIVRNDYVIFTIDVGGSSSWAELYLRQNKPNTLLTSDRFGNMGFTLPAAIAASKVVPEANVIGITGDGGMLMTLGEIATAVEQKSNIKVIVMNDRQYTMIKNIQRSRHGYPPFQVDIHTPNFDEIAKSFGANGIRIDDPRDLSAILEEALNIKGPTIIDVHTTNEYESYRYRL